MGRSDKYGHEIYRRRDAGNRTLARDPVGDRVSVGPADMAVRARDILRLLAIENTRTEPDKYKRSFLIGGLAHEISLHKAHALLGLNYDPLDSVQERNQLAMQLEPQLWKLPSEELEKLSVHYFLLRQLDDPTKAEALRQHMIDRGIQETYKLQMNERFEITLTEAERAQVLSKLANRNNARVKD